MQREKILITGANGQIGKVLTVALREVFGLENVVATDLRSPNISQGIFEQLDATDFEAMSSVVVKHGITQLYHLAAVLSARGEADPTGSWHINMNSTLNVLEAGRIFKLSKVFIPSSIAVFGSSAPKEGVHQCFYPEPETVYGIAKVAGENWGAYYFNKYGLDVRSLRFPGVIGYQSAPGGGTTDYAVEIFHKAISEKSYTCFLEKHTRLPMIYMDDAIRATLRLMEAPADRISIRTAYNLQALSFSPEQLATEIQQHIPDFSIEYKPDFRQKIAEGWPGSIDDSLARHDWNWKPAYGLQSLTKDMIKHLSESPQFA
ncbi:NAD-dependent epimerase/dehydratase family protein [Desertivirga arenae]|uniref:NAD-dependent epimerase/dehydratase family protein n=1 Tax=Desertivirga arenae TaxID=2810309 RepID=UPI001A95B833|nr:NAD-dependent epimerase/dehydratase family protein [Pedobacter sp. SYSU D00823]